MPLDERDQAGISFNALMYFIRRSRLVLQDRRRLLDLIAAEMDNTHNVEVFGLLDMARALVIRRQRDDEEAGRGP